ncbi:hypothetical protein WJX72_011055 [[Myrmecia] bisecta]|uniref:Uncharacterized protein n=1 Tax=[Myrmecia] bisecta TaxID=41462 RepID=A0AAW1QA88_9CHLO
MNATLRSYVRSFRIKELMQCLEALGLSKKGKKAELQARLLAYFDGAESGGLVREQWKLDAAAKVITAMHYQMLGVQPPPAASPQADDTRQDAGDGQGPAKRMRVEGASPAYPHVQREQIPTGSSSSPGLQNGHVPMQPLRNGLSPQYTKLNNRRIRCNCGVHVDRGSMLQCKTCSVWQHAPCAVQPGAVAPDPFMCDMCRLARVDPYWTQSEELVATTRLRPQVGRGMTAAAANGTQLQVLERGFNLSAAQYNQVRGAPGHYQIQVACMLMDDVVPNRYHWPCNADLRINNMQYRPYGRHANTKLGPNGRDEPASIAVMCYAGRNRITLTCLDSRPFYMVVRIVRKLSMEEVKAMMHAPETMEQAVARVKSQVRGGKAAADGNDSDDDLITLSTIVSLKCPLSGSRIETPGRFHGVAGLGTFDLDTFLCMAERSRKWQCPHSLRNLSVHELQTDVYVARLLTCLQASPDILEVELDPEGRWRPAGSTGDWHDIMADPATLVALIVKVKPEPEAVMAGDDSDEEEELSAAEELRRAASAYAAASKPRQPPKPPSPEVIDLISDSSDDEQQSPPPARRTLLTAVQANPSLLRPSQAAVQQNRSNGGAGPSDKRALGRVGQHAVSQHVGWSTRWCPGWRRRLLECIPLTGRTAGVCERPFGQPRRYGWLVERQLVGAAESPFESQQPDTGSGREC